MAAPVMGRGVPGNQFPARVDPEEVIPFSLSNPINFNCNLLPNHL
jgi:hypothetical protein